jgi:dihydrofolate reductase
MRKIIGGGFITLDGVFESPEKWNPPYYGDEMGKAAYQLYSECDALLLGRRSYELYKSVFQNMGPDHPQAGWMNNTPKYVVSSTLKKAEWNKTSIISQDVVGQVTGLKRQEGNKNILASGANLTSFLLDNGLLDEIYFLVHPLVLGTGRHFFEEARKQTALKLVTHNALGNGVILLRYELEPQSKV